MSMAQKPGFTQRSKSMRMCHHNVRQCEKDEVTTLKKIKGTENPADVLTKGLPRHLNDRHVSHMFHARHDGGSKSESLHGMRVRICRNHARDCEHGEIERGHHLEMMRPQQENGQTTPKEKKEDVNPIAKNEVINISHTGEKQESKGRSAQAKMETNRPRELLRQCMEARMQLHQCLDDAHTNVKRENDPPVRRPPQPAMRRSRRTNRGAPPMRCGLTTGATSEARRQWTMCTTKSLQWDVAT